MSAYDEYLKENIKLVVEIVRSKEDLAGVVSPTLHDAMTKNIRLHERELKLLELGYRAGQEAAIGRD